MLAATFLLATLGWSTPPSSVGRRDATFGAAAAALFASPLPALAKSKAVSRDALREYQTSAPKAAPGAESEAFKAAEQARIARAGGATKKAETAEEEIKRLGLGSYTQALENGYDCQKTWRGCDR